MALVTCKSCSEKISKKAKSCPKCGEPAPKKTSMVTWLFLVVVVFVVFAVVSVPTRDDAAAVRSVAVVKPVVVDAVRQKVVALFKSAQESTAKDAVWTSAKVFKVGVMHDGTARNAYAEYVCQVLYENGFDGQGVWVQVVDYAVLMRAKKWVRIGQSHCR